jgi:hypothetical protein
MLDFVSLIIAVVVFNFVWNTDAPFSSTLCVTEDRFVFRTKYPAYYRSEDSRERIETLASRLQATDRIERYLKR